MSQEPIPPSLRHSDGTTSQGRLTSSPPEWLHDLDGKDLTFFRVDHQTRLQFDAFEVVIESPFTLLVPPRGEHHLDPEDRGALGPLLALYPLTLARLRVADASMLRLDFENGVTITVQPHDMYEAWQVTGPANKLIVCTPSGGLAVWS